jgi:hypothetical protein
MGGRALLCQHIQVPAGAQHAVLRVRLATGGKRKLVDNLMLGGLKSVTASLQMQHQQVACEQPPVLLSHIPVTVAV